MDYKTTKSDAEQQTQNENPRYKNGSINHKQIQEIPSKTHQNLLPQKTPIFGQIRTKKRQANTTPHTQPLDRGEKGKVPNQPQPGSSSRCGKPSHHASSDRIGPKISAISMASKSGKPQQTIPKKGRNFLETGRASLSPPTPPARRAKTGPIYLLLAASRLLGDEEKKHGCAARASERGMDSKNRGK
ncbi:hypothetical protein ABZP36_005614 [Zizania latifolia]